MDFERWGITNVQPVFEGGRFPAKCIINEVFPICAKVFREGHDALGSTAVIVDPKGQEFRFPMRSVGYAGDDDWEGLVQAPYIAGDAFLYRRVV